LNLLQSLSSEFDFVVWRLLRLLDKSVEHNNSLPNEETVERPTNTRPTAGPQLKQAIAKSSRIRQFQIGAMLNEQLNDTRIVRENIGGPRINLGLHPLMEVLNRICHEQRLAIL
jgi:hypothetical protein